MGYNHNYYNCDYKKEAARYLRRENRRNRLPFRFTKIGRWWEKSEELDILAIDAGKENYLIGECKYKNSPFACSDFKRMQGKFVPQKEGSSLYYYLFSKSGFSPELAKEAEGQKIHMIGADELI